MFRTIVHFAIISLLLGMVLTKICFTKSGKPCWSTFIYGGKYYYGCTNVSYTTEWCVYDVNTTWEDCAGPCLACDKDDLEPVGNTDIVEASNYGLSYPDLLPPVEKMIMRALEDKYQFQLMTALIPVDDYTTSISEFPFVPIEDLKASIYEECAYPKEFNDVPPPSEQFNEGIEVYEYYNYAWKWACIGFKPIIRHMFNHSDTIWDKKFEEELLQGRAHFSIGFVPIEEVKAFNHLVLRSAAYANYNEYALGRTPQPANNLLNLVQVLDLATWIALAFGLLLFSILAFGFLKIYNHVGVKNAQEVTFMDIFIVMFTGFTEPTPINWFNNQNKGGLLLALTWSIFAFIMTLSYSSTLLSFLTLPLSEKVVQDVNDILGLEKIILVYPFDEDGFDLDYMKTIFPEDVALWAENHKNVLFSIDKDELKFKILTMGNVLIDTKRGILDGDLFSDYLDKIRFSAKPVTFDNNDDCLSVGKGFPWTDLVLNDMLRMSAGGIFEHMFYSGISPKNLQILQPRNKAKATSTNDPINLDQVAFIFLFWLSGIAIAGFFFLMERF